jgi:hypothetical protein
LLYFNMPCHANFRSSTIKNQKKYLIQYDDVVPT